MATYYRQGKTYTVAFRLKGHRRQYIYGIKSESLAQKSKAKKDLEEQLARADLHTPDPKADRYREAARESVQKHLDAYERSILARGKTAKHAAWAKDYAGRLLKGAKTTRIDQLDADAIQSAAKKMLDDGLSPRTCNHALSCVRAFSRWLKKSKRCAVDQLAAALERFNEQGDIRRRRREMSSEELVWLIDTTEQRKYRAGMTGHDRVVLYLAGLGTGYRRSALLSLHKASFDVAATVLRPGVILGAEFNKNRKPRRQPIRADLAALLREWLPGRPDKGSVFTSMLPQVVTRAFRADMDAARSAWLESLPPKKREDAGKTSFLKYQHDDGNGFVYADFHGLRHTGITLVVRHAGIRVGQAWADHSTPVLTAKYAHVGLTDEDKALEALPAVAQDKAKSGKKKTG